MTSLGEIPFLEILKAKSKHVLLAGCGGGCDVFLSLPLCHYLWANGIKVTFFSVSFAWLNLDDESKDGIPYIDLNRSPNKTPSNNLNHNCCGDDGSLQQQQQNSQGIAKVSSPPSNNITSSSSNTTSSSTGGESSSSSSSSSSVEVLPLFRITAASPYGVRGDEDTGRGYFPERAFAIALSEWRRGQKKKNKKEKMMMSTTKRNQAPTTLSGENDEPQQQLEEAKEEDEGDVDEEDEITVYTLPRPYCCFKTVRKSYAYLCQTLGCDAIVTVDGGSDSLMRGDEDGLGSYEEDAASVLAAASMALPEMFFHTFNEQTHLRNDLSTTTTTTTSLGPVQPPPTSTTKKEQSPSSLENNNLYCLPSRLAFLCSMGLGCDSFHGVSDVSSLRTIAELSKPDTNPVFPYFASDSHRNHGGNQSHNNHAIHHPPPCDCDESKQPPTTLANRNVVVSNSKSDDGEEEESENNSIDWLRYGYCSCISLHPANPAFKMYRDVFETAYQHGVPRSFVNGPIIASVQGEFGKPKVGEDRPRTGSQWLNPQMTLLHCFHAAAIANRMVPALREALTSNMTVKICYFSLSATWKRIRECYLERSIPWYLGLRGTPHEALPNI